jgi:hypothetical protein
LVSTVAGLNFDGATSIVPPDPNGSVGPSQYVQVVNWDKLSVYSKATGSLVYGPVTISSSIFHLFGGPCEQFNDGDAVVVSSGSIIVE